MKSKSLRINGFLEESCCNGPGKRAVIWVQGCSLGCAGCFNPETHSFDGGEEHSIEELFKRITEQQNRIEGVTISGGEPLLQAENTFALLKLIKSQTSLSVLMFSGFNYDEIQKMPAACDISNLVDVLIAGRYEESNHVGKGLIGSANKKVYFFSDRYKMADLEMVPEAEIVISENGEVVLSGIDPLRLR